MFIEKSEKELGTPKSNKEYRFWRRNNAIRWKGVETDRVKQHPLLIKQVSKRGEVHYVEE